MDDNKQGKTFTYGSADPGKTGTYNEAGTNSEDASGKNNGTTHAYTESKKSNEKTTIQGISIGETITLRGKDFKITTKISEGTGEAVIFKIEDSFNKTFALKLYLPVTNHKEEPSFETLKRIITISDPDILKLYDFGVGPDKYLGKYCYEISDFAEGGDLLSVTDFSKKYTPEFLEKKIIPELFRGISKLHELKIYHCDLKPSNIFYKDAKQADIVIGDYGSAKAYDLDTEKESRKSSTVKGTDAYLSPEQARGIVSEKNDYYSLGMVLLQLAYPEHISTDEDYRQIDKIKFEKIVEREFSSKPIIEFNPKLARLNNLIEGLTLFNHVNRFGKSEVKDWLNGKILPVKYQSSEYEKIIPINLGYATIWKEDDLLNVIHSYPKQWYEDLIEDKDGYLSFKRWLESYKGAQIRRKVDEMLRFYQPLGKKYVEQSILRYFKPDLPIRLDVHTFDFHNSKNLKSDVESYIKKLDEYWKSNNIEWIKYQLFLIEFTLRQLSGLAVGPSGVIFNTLIEKLFAAFGLVPKTFDDYKTIIQTILTSKETASDNRILLSLFYTFFPDRKFRDLKNNAYATLEEMALFFAKNDDDAFKQKYLVSEKEAFLKNVGKSNWCSLDLKELLFNVFSGKESAQIELVSLTFDKKRNLKISYKYFKSLDPFLSTKNVNKSFTSQSGKTLTYNVKIAPFYLLSKEFKKFTNYLFTRHGISDNENVNIPGLRHVFLSKARKRLFYIMGGRFAALCLALPVSILIFYILTQRLHIDSNWRFHSGYFRHVSNDESRINSVQKKFIVLQNANLRSGPSTRYKVIGKVTKGEYIRVLSKERSNWLLVSKNGKRAYIFGKMIKEVE